MIKKMTNYISLFMTILASVFIMSCSGGFGSDSHETDEFEDVIFSKD